MADSDDLLLATASGENVKLWNMPNLELHSIRPFSGLVNSTCWSSNSILLRWSKLLRDSAKCRSLQGVCTLYASQLNESKITPFISPGRKMLKQGFKMMAKPTWETDVIRLIEKYIFFYDVLRIWASTEISQNH